MAEQCSEFITPLIIEEDIGIIWLPINP
jgi:hypothetical protein